MFFISILGGKQGACENGEYSSLKKKQLLPRWCLTLLLTGTGQWLKRLGGVSRGGT